MFNLEQAIAEWRREMLAAGIKTPVPLEELEGHLREEIQRQMQSGLSARRALAIAVQAIGPASEIKSEFKKIGTPMKTTTIIKLAGLICVVVASFCPLFMVLPFLGDPRLSLMPKMLAAAVYAATVAAILLSWKYNHKFLPVIREPSLRRAVGLVCYAGCLLWIRFGIFQFFPGGLNPRSIFLALFIFGLEWALVAILGGIGHGLEKAARKNSKQYV